MNKSLKKLIFASIMLAAAFLLPFLTANVTELGNMLCLMHLPVIICGFVCGWRHGLAVGAIAPLLRSLTIGAPPLMPTALAMAFELAVYGFMAGLLYKLLPKKLPYTYISLVGAMLAGRVVWGLTYWAITSAMGMDFTFIMFLTSAFANALPGIAIQIVIIPPIVFAINKIKKAES